MKKYNFVGSKVDYWLPDDIQVEIAIVPSSVTNVRSNRFSLDQTTVTIHETANFNTGANADMHKRWLHGGASGSFVGFNFVVDDKKIIQLTPLNEDTWAAGTAVGNRTSWHIESCVNKDADLNKTRRNTAALAGSILAAQGWAIGAMVQHYIWYHKNCPALMRANNGAIWKNSFVPMATTARAESIAAATGGKPTPKPEPTPEPTPEYASASPVAALKDERPFLMTDGGAIFVRADLVVEATRDTPRLKYAGGSAKVGPDVKKGERFGVSYLIVNDDKSLYWYTPWATRIRYEDTRVIEEDAS